MARARNIKPAFFKNEQVVELPFSTRLLFVGLWTLSDREGRLADKPKWIKMEIFPGDSLDIEKGLAELVDARLIQRYEAGGERYIQVLTFLKHQNPHHKEPPSTIPKPGVLPPMHDGKNPGFHADGSGTEPEAISGQAQGLSVVEGGGSPADSGFLIPDPPSLIPESREKAKAPRANGKAKASETQLPPDFAISERVKAWAKERGILKLDQHLESFKFKCKAKGYLYVDWDSAFMEAIRKDWAGLRESQQAIPDYTEAIAGFKD